MITVRRITPESVTPLPFRARCEACPWALSDKTPEGLNAWAEAHVRATGHAVTIEGEADAAAS